MLTNKSVQFSLDSKLLPCAPPIWARTGHLQTILGHLLPSPALQDEGELVELEVSGGDKVIAHFYSGTSDVVVYLFHGLGGFSHAPYMQRTALLAKALGHSVFMYNHRGCGAGAGLAREPYHSGRAEDLSALVNYGKKLFSSRIHLAIGFSLSANALLLLAADQRATVLPDAAIAVNAPINLAHTALMLRRGLNKIYDMSFMLDMREAVRSRHARDPKLKEVSIPLRTTLTEFDDLFTAPYSGFKNRDDYYSQCSAKQFLSDVKIPTVILTAEDDPFIDFREYKTATYSPNCIPHFEKSGGHMGYLSKTTQLPPRYGRRWLDYALDSYLQALRY